MGWAESLMSSDPVGWFLACWKPGPDDDGSECSEDSIVSVGARRGSDDNICDRPSAWPWIGIRVRGSDWPSSGVVTLEDGSVSSDGASFADDASSGDADSAGWPVESAICS